MSLSLMDTADNTVIYKVYDVKTEKFYKLDVIIRSEYQRLEDYLSEISDYIDMVLHIRQIKSFG